MRVRERHRVRRAIRAAGAVCAVAVAAAAQAATITVTTLADVDVGSDGQCSLREAIEAANIDASHHECAAGDGADTIDFAVNGTMVLNADLQEISGPLAIRGPGRDLLAIDGGLQHKGFRIDAVGGELLEISELTLTRASGAFGAAISVAIDDSVTLTDVLVSDSEASFGGGLYADDAGDIRLIRTEVSGNRGLLGGGGLYVTGSASLFVQDSTIAENIAGPPDGTTDANGGGIYLVVTDFEIRRSTLSGNRARGHGGAIFLSASSGLIRNSTVVDNLADSDGDGHSGGGLRIENLAGDAVSLGGTVVALNEDGSGAPDAHADLSLDGGDVTTLSYNWVGDHSSVEATFPAPTVAGDPNLNADFVGTPGAPLDPVLSVLSDNGGGTRTHRPLAASPLVDQGDCPVATQDQRGYGDPATGRRTVDDPAIPNLADGCDPGAVERGAMPLDGMPFVDGFESGDAAEWNVIVG